MKVKDQVCSFELAKRLKEFGAKQESLFWWNCVVSSGGWLLEDHQDGGSQYRELGTTGMITDQRGDVWKRT